jgi:hypothetical protein
VNREKLDYPNACTDVNAHWEREISKQRPVQELALETPAYTLDCKEVQPGFAYWILKDFRKRGREKGVVTLVDLLAREIRRTSFKISEYCAIIDKVTSKLTCPS